jgi:8-oxo-dGTP pyrophosphatase MutT (NUDIX family)
MDLTPYIVTAGVYVNRSGFFPFQVGPTKTGETLGVVRLGGHRETGETGWECAAREAFEEASIRVRPVEPPATYWVDNDEFYPKPWILSSVDQIAPIVVTTRDGQLISPIYLGHTDDEPVPADEARSLLLLTHADIDLIVTRTVTLRQYLERGGQARFKESLALDLVLEPFGHLKILHRLVHIHPEIAR